MIERRHVAHIGHAARLSLAVVLTVAVAGCSGGDDAGSTTTADSTDPTGVSTTVPVTTAPTTTTAAITPSTTAPTTTPSDPTTTAPPSSTATPSTTEADVIAEVTAAAFAYDAWYVECLRKPADCDPSEVSPAGSDALTALTKTRDDLVAGGLFVGPEDRGYTVVEGVEAVEGGYRVKVCGYTTLVLYGPPGPDGKPTVQNDTAGTVRESWLFTKVADRWMFTHGDIVSQESEVNSCPPE